MAGVASGAHSSFFAQPIRLPLRQGLPAVHHTVSDTPLPQAMHKLPACHLVVCAGNIDAGDDDSSRRRRSLLQAVGHRF